MPIPPAALDPAREAPRRESSTRHCAGSIDSVLTVSSGPVCGLSVNCVRGGALHIPGKPN